MTAWRNRIVGEGEQPASQFIANPANWRTHPQAQRDAMRGALNEVGWVQRVIVNRRTGYLVDGHERVWQALQNGDALVPYVEVDLSPEEEAYVLATLDPIGAMAMADKEKLGELLDEISTDGEAIMSLLSDLAEKESVWSEPPIGDTSTDRDGQGVASPWQQVAGAEKARVVLGDVEVRIEPAVMQRTLDALEKAFAEKATPYADTMMAILTAGCDAID